MNYIYMKEVFQSQKKSLLQMREVSIENEIVKAV